MSQPYNDIKQAITDAAKPIEERRPKPLPNWFECVCPEDYEDDRPGITAEDPATGDDVKGGVKGKPKKVPEIKKPS